MLVNNYNYIEKSRVGECAAKTERGNLSKPLPSICKLNIQYNTVI